MSGRFGRGQEEEIHPGQHIYEGRHFCWVNSISCLNIRTLLTVEGPFRFRC